MEATKETIFGTRVAYEVRMMPKLRIHAQCREIARYHTDDGNALHARCSVCAWDMTCAVVTALCNQPEAFASDFGDNQSRYLLLIILHLLHLLLHLCS